MTTNYNNRYEEGLPSLCGGINRMDDEPMPQFDCEEGGSTPRPGGNRFTDEQAEALLAEKQKIQEWRQSFSIAAKDSALRNKKRRSINSRTVYWPMTHKLCSLGMTELEARIDKTDKNGVTVSETITRSQFELMKHVMNRSAIRLNVDDTMSVAKLKDKFEEAKRNEENAQVSTMAAFSNAMKKAKEKLEAAAAEAAAAEAAAAEAAAAEAAESANPIVVTESAEKIARLDPDYLKALREFHDIKEWKDTLSKEHSRCSRNVWNPKLPQIVPTAHACIAASLRPKLSNILSPGTLNRPFISLDILTSTIAKEYVSFLTEPNRHNDRKIVAEQIAESVAKQRQQKKQ